MVTRAATRLVSVYLVFSALSILASCHCYCHRICPYTSFFFTAVDTVAVLLAVSGAQMAVATLGVSVSMASLLLQIKLNLLV